MAKFIKKQNMVMTTGKYTDKQGNEKSRYHTFGNVITMQEDDGGQYQFGEIPMLGIKFSIYDQKPREGDTTQKPAVPIIQQDGNPTSIKPEEGDIDPKSIPF